MLWSSNYQSFPRSSPLSSLHHIHSNTMATMGIITLREYDLFLIGNIYLKIDIVLIVVSFQVSLAQWINIDINIKGFAIYRPLLTKPNDPNPMIFFLRIVEMTPGAFPISWNIHHQQTSLLMIVFRVQLVQRPLSNKVYTIQTVGQHQR